MQVYFPAIGRQLTLPAMLQGSDLARLLKEQRHEEVLERTNIQCEPDSKDYIRVCVCVCCEVLVPFHPHTIVFVSHTPLPAVGPRFIFGPAPSYPLCSQVHHTVYEDLDRRGMYDILRSTRHFGGMVWYLLSRQQLRGLLGDMLERNL